MAIDSAITQTTTASGDRRSPARLAAARLDPAPAVPPTATTLADYLALWLERRDPFTKPQGLRKLGYRTWAAAESRVRNHINPLIGDTLLADLCREDVVWLGELAELGARPPTLQKCRDHLVSALRQAIKERSWGVSAQAGNPYRVTEYARNAITMTAEAPSTVAEMTSLLAA